jgi:hypothetical protein
MDKPRLLLLIGMLAGHAAMAQVEIRGTVYDRSLQYAMRGVSVMGVSGTGTMTDSLGRYSIRLAPGDSLYFSYLGRSTSRFLVKEIPAGPFDMSLQVAVDTLPSVLVQPRNYRQDSLANREEYRNVFDFSPRYFTNMKMERRAGMGVGINMDMFFDAKHNRQMLKLQERLEEEEKETYVDHRFTRALVRRVTGLEAPALDTFMHQYRPSYDMLKSFETDYEFYKYIRESAQYFEPVWKRDHPD